MQYATTGSYSERLDVAATHRICLKQIRHPASHGRRILPNTTDFRCFEHPGVLRCSCSVHALESVSDVVRAWLLPACAGGGGARFRGPRLPADRGCSFLLRGAGDLGWSGESGREHLDLGFPGYGVLGGRGVREFRACFLGAFSSGAAGRGRSGRTAWRGRRRPPRRRVPPATMRP